MQTHSKKMKSKDFLLLERDVKQKKGACSETEMKGQILYLNRYLYTIINGLG